MGMHCYVQALTSRQIEALYADSTLALEIMMAHRAKGAGMFFGESLREQLYLEKGWAIMRFLLLRAAGASDDPDREDWSSELLFGDAIGADTGCGEPYLRSIAETREFASFLQPLTLGKLLLHLDCEEMVKEQVYAVAEENLSEENYEIQLCEYIGHYFAPLRDYVLQAAASQCGLLLTIA